MAFVAQQTIREALAMLHNFRESVNSQGVTHLLPFLALRRKNVGPDSERPFEEQDDFDFWDRYCRIDSGENARYPYADPITGQMRISTHPHSNVATARKGTFALMWHAASYRTDTQSRTLWRLADDYLDTLRDHMLTKRGITTTVPAWAMAAWLLRGEDLGSAPECSDLIAAFVAVFNLSGDDIGSLFDRTERRIEVANVAATDAELRPYFATPAAQGVQLPAASGTPPSPLPVAPGLVLDPQLRARVGAALAAGQHILLVGPPGTGKSSIAVSLAQDARAAGRCAGAEVTTATGDWTSFETFGGFVPGGGGVRLLPGVVLRALAENRWLILDELNRANIDRVIGPLVTVLGGRDQSIAVELPLFDGDHPLRIERRPGTKDSSREGPTYVVGDDWRLIATMNTFDRVNLFPLSAALARRFATIYVGVSDPDAVLEALGCPLPSPLWGFARRIMEEDFDGESNPRPLGPAFVKDMVAFGQHASPHEPGSAQVSVDAVALFVLPQLNGLELSEANLVIEQLVDAAAEFVGDGDREIFRRSAVARLSLEFRRLQGL